MKWKQSDIREVGVKVVNIKKKSQEYYGPRQIVKRGAKEAKMRTAKAIKAKHVKEIAN